MGRPYEYFGSSMEYLLIDKASWLDHRLRQRGLVPIYHLLLFSLFRSCVYLLLNYRMTAAPLPLVDLVGFRPCAHFLSVYVLPPDPPTPLQFRTYIYHLAYRCPSFLPFFLFIPSLFVGCSLYFYVLFGLLSIPRIPCRCCDEYILTRTKYLCIF